MTSHDVKGMDEGFDNYWKRDIDEVKRDKFIKLFNTNEELVNMTPEMAKEQFRMITPVHTASANAPAAPPWRHSAETGGEEFRELS